MYTYTAVVVTEGFHLTQHADYVRTCAVQMTSRKILSSYQPFHFHLLLHIYCTGHYSAFLGYILPFQLQLI